MLGSHADADSLVQETFLRAFENLSSFRGASSTPTWLWRIACNLCLDLLRRRRRHRRALHAWQRGREGASEEPADAVEAVERRAIVREALEELEPIALGVQQISYTSGSSPARGGHRFSTPSRCRTRTTVWVNELMEV